jgi:hypothetical protein
MMTSEDQRKFERVPLAMDWGALQPLLGAVAHWSNHEAVPVFDLSYRGLAMGRPVLQTLERDARQTLSLDLGLHKGVKLQVRVVWMKPEIVGVEIESLESRARQDLANFLEDRLIGRHLHRVDRRYYDAAATFTAWYHGPRDTNVFLWQDTRTGMFTRFEIEFDGQVVWFDGRQLLQGGGRARSLTDEIGENAAQEPVILRRDSPLIERALSVLSQIDEPRGPLRDFLSEFKSAGS